MTVAREWGKGGGEARLAAPVVLISFISENEFKNERARKGGVSPDSVRVIL